MSLSSIQSYNNSQQLTSGDFSGVIVWRHLCQTSHSVTADQLTDKMSDSEEGFDILSDIKPYSFEPLAKTFRDSINCEELAAASAHMNPEQTPSPQQELDWCFFVCVGITLIDKSTHWAWMRVFLSSYRITSFKIKWYLSVNRSPDDVVYTEMYHPQFVFLYILF